MGSAASAVKRLTHSFRGKGSAATPARPATPAASAQPAPGLQIPEQVQLEVQHPKEDQLEARSLIHSPPRSPHEDDHGCKTELLRQHPEVDDEPRMQPLQQAAATALEAHLENCDESCHGRRQPSKEMQVARPDARPANPEPPHPWVRVPYEDDFYFWNTATDEVTWEFPAADSTGSSTELRGLGETQAPSVAVDGLESDEDDDSLMGVLNACREAKAWHLHGPDSQHAEEDQHTPAAPTVPDHGFRLQQASSTNTTTPSQGEPLSLGPLEEKTEMGLQAQMLECRGESPALGTHQESLANSAEPEQNEEAARSWRGTQGSHVTPDVHMVSMGELETERRDRLDRGKELRTSTSQADEEEVPMTEQISRMNEPDPLVYLPPGLVEGQEPVMSMASRLVETSPISALVLPAGCSLPVQFASRASRFYELVKLRKCGGSSHEGAHNFFDTYRVLRQQGKRPGTADDALRVGASPMGKALPADLGHVEAGSMARELVLQGLMQRASEDLLPVSQDSSLRVTESKCSFPRSVPASPEAKEAMAKPKWATKAMPKGMPKRAPNRQRVVTPARAEADAALVAVYTGRACGSNRPLHRRPEWQ